MTTIAERADMGRVGNDRRRAAFTKGDLVAVTFGALLVVAVICWLCVLVAQNVIADRAVATGRPPSSAPGP